MDGYKSTARTRLTSGELRELLVVAVENRELIRRYWNEHFGV